MKKIKLLLILFISIFIFNLKVFAGANLSVSADSVTTGGTFTVYVNMYNAAAWNIHVSASGPVSGCSINQADATADAMDTNKTFTATCTATGTGTISVLLSGDVTSANDGIAVMLSGNASVIVTEPVVNPTPAPQPESQPSQPQNNLSTNNNIGSLIVEGYDLKKVDNNNYSLTVSNNVTSINIIASAEDSKATVTGNGKHELNVGENNIEIVVTSESGWQNKINIKVIRKDGYYLEDLNTLLEDKKNNDVDVIINSDTKITQKQVKQIKDSKKTLRFNYYNEEKKLIYSWTLDGSKINKLGDVVTTISNNSDEVKTISELSNYADGLYVNFEHDGKLPEGTKVKLYVGDKFEDGNAVNIYHYAKNKEKLENVMGGVQVQDGYIEFNIEHCSEYFVTMSNLMLNNDSTSVNIFLILSIIEFITIVILLVVYFLKLNKTTNKEEKINIIGPTYQQNVENNNQNDLIYRQGFQNINNIENQEEIKNDISKF